MKVCKEGKYTKFINFKNNILAFVSKNEDDNYFKILKMINEKHSDYTGHQCCETKEEFNNFKNVLYISYNIYGQLKYAIYLQFDFENNIVIIDNKKYKIKDDPTHEYTYKFQKTQIKATDGIKGFYKFVIDSMNINSPFHNSFYYALEERSK